MNDSRKRTAIYFAVILICWIPYIVLCFPGNIAYDTGTAIAWYKNLDRTNPNNPYFLNWLFGFFYSLGSWWNQNLRGIALYCFLQAFFTAFLLAKTLVLIQEKTRIQKPLYILLGIYALIPTFPLYAFTMAKDSILALVILLFEYLAIQAITEPEQFWGKRTNCVLLGASIVLMGLTRNFAGYLPAIAFLIYALCSRQKRIIITACATLTGVLFFSIALPGLLGIPGTETKEGLSVPLQTTAYYLQEHPEEMTEEEREAITQVMPTEEWLKRYNKDISDPLKEAAQLDGQTTGPFLRTWLKLWGKHPLTMIRGWYRGTDGYILPWIQTTVKDHAIVGNRMNIDILRALGLDQWRNPLEINARNADEWMLNLPIIGMISKIGLYSWILILLTVLILIRRQWKILLCLTPLLTIFFGCLGGPVNGYYRYAFPYIMSVPLLLMFITGGMKRGKKRIRSDLSKGRITDGEDERIDKQQE